MVRTVARSRRDEKRGCYAVLLARRMTRTFSILLPIQLLDPPKPTPLLWSISELHIVFHLVPHSISITKPLVEIAVLCSIRMAKLNHVLLFHVAGPRVSLSQLADSMFRSYNVLVFLPLSSVPCFSFSYNLEHGPDESPGLDFCHGCPEEGIRSWDKCNCSLWPHLRLRSTVLHPVSLLFVFILTTRPCTYSTDVYTSLRTWHIEPSGGQHG